jgi:hypothetical protein
MPNLSRSLYTTSLLSLAAAILLPASAAAQNGYLFQPPVANLSVRLGVGGPTAPSTDPFFGVLTDTLSLKPADFRTTSFSVDLGIQASPRFDVVVGFARDASTNPSEYQNWLDENNQPIRQTTEIQRMPLTVSGKFYLVSRGRSLAKHAWIPVSLTPYVTAGGGVMFYKIQQNGDWIDVASSTHDIFSDSFYSSGAGFTGHVGGGANWWFSSHLGLTADARYAWGSAKLKGDFSEFCPTSGPDQCNNRIDLRGFQITTGLAVQF